MWTRWINIYLPSLVKRLLRLGRVATFTDGQRVVEIVKKYVLIWHGSELVAKIYIDRGSRPLQSGVCLVDGCLYYGDYWGNPEREPVNLYRLQIDIAQKEVVYTFKQARHIHFVQPDRDNDNCLLIGTGDLDHESAIYRLELNNYQLTMLGGGDQRYRAVSVLQLPDYLIWGSDDPDGDNYIYRYHKTSQQLECLHPIAGPAYYSAQDRQGRLYIATTIEDRQKHRAIIYYSTDGGSHWQPYKEFKKDIWHTKYFGYGVVQFVEQQQNMDTLHYKLVGLKEIDSG